MHTPYRDLLSPKSLQNYKKIFKYAREIYFFLKKMHFFYKMFVYIVTFL